jgi:hypothetical protein
MKDATRRWGISNTTAIEANARPSHTKVYETCGVERDEYRRRTREGATESSALLFRMSLVALATASVCPRAFIGGERRTGEGADSFMS